MVVFVDGDEEATLDVAIRFLQVVERRVARATPDGFEDVDELSAGDQRYLSWDEATEREAMLPSVTVEDLLASRSIAVDIPADFEAELLRDSDGVVVGAIRRSWREIQAELIVVAERVGETLYRVTARVSNVTPFDGASRSDAMSQTMVSMHAVLHVHAGSFLSVQQPPAECSALIAQNDPDGLWPVLIGTPGDASTMLAAPIILSDYPAVAPESPGDLFDGGEIDQLLILNVLALTDEEQREMRDSDPRAREILERCRSLTPEQLMRLHGMVRDTGAAALPPTNDSGSAEDANPAPRA